MPFIIQILKALPMVISLYNQIQEMNKKKAQAKEAVKEVEEKVKDKKESLKKKVKDELRVFKKK